MGATKLINPDATQFLLSLRKAYLKDRPNPAEYLTFYVSATVFKQYTTEAEACARYLEPMPPKQYCQYKYFVQRIRVKENPVLHTFETNIVEGRRDWEEA